METSTTHTLGPRRYGMAVVAVAALVLFAFPGAAGAALAKLSWSAPIDMDASTPLTGVACPSSSSPPQCTAVDAEAGSGFAFGKGQEVTFDPESASTQPKHETIYSQLYLASSVACSSSKECIAVDGGPQEVTFDPETGEAISGGPPKPETLYSRINLSSIACPSTAQCTAVGASEAGGEEVTFDPQTGPSSARSLAIDSDGSIASVACPSTAQCTAVGASEIGGEEVTFDPESGTAIGSLTRIDMGILTSVACPPGSSTQCTAVDTSGHEVTFNPTSPDTHTSIDIDGATHLTGIACPAEKQCTAVDSSGDEVTFNPEVPGTPTPTPTPIDKGALASIACPSITLCVAVDGKGYAVVGTATGGPPAGLENVGSGEPTAETTDPDHLLSATGTGGTGTVTVGEYASQPAGTPALGNSTGKYFDVFLEHGNSYQSLAVTECGLASGESFEWFNPQANSGQGAWETVSPAPTETSPGCFTVTLTKMTATNPSKPNLEQLTGTVFAVVNPPPSSSSSSTSSSSTSTTSSSSPSPSTSSSQLPSTPATGVVTLTATTIAVKSSGQAAVELSCTGTSTCAGTLTLTAMGTNGHAATAKTKKGKKRGSKTTTIGTANFSIPAGKTGTFTLTLNAAGRALLKADHGRLSASLTILKSSPSPASTQTESVHLVLQKASEVKKRKK